jgi:hypothetical protein
VPVLVPLAELVGDAEVEAGAVELLLLPHAASAQIAAAATAAPRIPIEYLRPKGIAFMSILSSCRPCRHVVEVLRLAWFGHGKPNRAAGNL